MNTKATVRYICEHYIHTGLKLYYKTELLTSDSFRNLDSLYWSKPRPITAQTFRKAEKAGYTCDTQVIRRKPAEIISLDDLRGNRDVKRKTKAYGKRNRSGTP